MMIELVRHGLGNRCARRWGFRLSQNLADFSKNPKSKIVNFGFMMQINGSRQSVISSGLIDLLAADGAFALFDHVAKVFGVGGGGDNFQIRFELLNNTR